MSSGAAAALTSDAFVFCGATGDQPILGDAAPLTDDEPGRAVVASEEGWQDPKREDTAPC